MIPKAPEVDASQALRAFEINEAAIDDLLAALDPPAWPFRINASMRVPLRVVGEARNEHSHELPENPTPRERYLHRQRTGGEQPRGSIANGVPYAAPLEVGAAPLPPRIKLSDATIQRIVAELGDLIGDAARRRR